MTFTGGVETQNLDPVPANFRLNARDSECIKPVQALCTACRASSTSWSRKLRLMASGVGEHQVVIIYRQKARDFPSHIGLCTDNDRQFFWIRYSRLLALGCRSWGEILTSVK